MCPSWCIHPCFCSDLGIYDVEIINPEDSPNTDGINPESCEDVEIAGCHFSLGDDCIAIKSGKGRRAQEIPYRAAIFRSVSVLWKMAMAA